MILNSNTKYSLINFSNGKFEYIYNKDNKDLTEILKEKNLDNNVYTILNDFYKERTIKSLV